jgi:hypothetical protein
MLGKDGAPAARAGLRVRVHTARADQANLITSDHPPTDSAPINNRSEMVAVDAWSLGVVAWRIGCTTTESPYGPG